MVAGVRTEPDRDGVGSRPASWLDPRRIVAGLPVRAAATYAFWVFLSVRVGLFVFGLLAVSLIPAADPAGVPGRDAGPTSGEHGLLEVWERWDALWYLRIASDGYAPDDGSAAFFPLYPLLVRSITWAFAGDSLLAGLFVANVAGYLGLVLLYLLSARECDEAVARRSTLYLAVFPTAFFLIAPYSESLFLLLVLAAFLAARQGSWWWAGGMGALAAATRSLGLVMVAALAVEALHQAWTARHPRGLLRSLPASGLPVMGLGGYLFYWWLRVRDATVPFDAQARWDRDADSPLSTFVAGTQEAFAWIGEMTGGYHLLDWLITVPVVVAAIWVALRARPTYAVFVWVSLLIALVFAWEARPFMSLPRFALVLFPIYWAGATWAARRPGIHEAVVAVSALLLGLNALLYLNWYYVF